MAHCVLDSKLILKTIGLLRTRIEERFPGSGLGQVCGELKGVAMQTGETIADIQKRRYGYRLLVFAFVLALAAVSVWTATRLEAARGDLCLIDLVQVLDAAFNVIVLGGGAILFLVSVENRTKRRKVIQAVNVLRCLAHVIDSHQLTKDPCYAKHGSVRTLHSPERNMDAFQLSRYLDYCAEMLSLVSKIGFLYVQDYHDPVATEAVNDLDDLTNGLSRKIWQKIMIIKKDADKPL